MAKPRKLTKFEQRRLHLLVKGLRRSGRSVKAQRLLREMNLRQGKPKLP